MSDFKPTPAQQQVIDARNKNVLVSAAAGSGKTAVLTERIVDRLLDETNPVSIDRLLIVTFTEAAAAEMRERIGKAIGERLKKDPGNEYLRKQYTLVNSALIMTIHGFCLYLIRNHFDRIGIDPSFRVQSSEEGKILLEDSLEEAILKMQKEKPEDYEMLLEIRDCEINDEKVRELIRKIHDVAQAQPFPADWIEEVRELVSKNGKDPENSRLFKESFDFETKVLRESLQGIKDALIDLNANLNEENKKELQKIIKVFEADKDYVEKLLSAGTMRERNKIHKETALPSMPGGAMAHVDSAYRKSLGILRNSRKNRIYGNKSYNPKTNSIRENMYLYSYDTILHDELESSKVILSLLDLSEMLLNTYAANKKKKNVIDFSDMEHFALEILLKKEDEEYVASETAIAYREYFDEVMVDEYQDSNFIQETLLNAVANITKDSGNRFMVGDVKQSIYRFRMANPEIFRKKYDEYRSVSPEEDLADVKERDIRIDLSQNFRSRTEVINSVNRVFEDSMIRAVGEIDYDENAKLNPGASYPEKKEGENSTELILISEEGWEGFENKNAIAKEAYACGMRILEMKAEGFTVTGKGEDGEAVLRPVDFSDMIILLRKTAKRANVIKNVLEGMGIPTVVLSKEGYFSTSEVQLMLNLISVIDNPLQDVPLLGVLHSFVGGFKESELAEIKCGRKKLLLYDAMKEYLTAGGEEELKGKIRTFFERLNAYRTLSERVGVYELLLQIVEEEGIFDHFRAMKMGEIRIANLKLLLKKAREYSATGYSGIFTFVQYIETMKKKEIDFGEANLLDENANVVRIFTMHKSKGLEFPVCFLLGLGENLNKSADKNDLVIETGIGMGMDYTDLEKRVKHPTLSKNMILYRSRVEQRGEDLRLLYVAMTRAKEKLILIGSPTDKLLEESDTAGPNRKFNEYEILGASSFLSFLYPEAKRNPDLFDLNFFQPESDEEETGSEEAGIKETGSEEAGIKETGSEELGSDETGNAENSKEALRKELEAVPASEKLSFFEYPHANLENIYKKTTVSELKRAAYREEPEGEADLFESGKKKEEALVPIIPEFIKKKEKVISGAEIGSAFHRMMQLLDFNEVAGILESLHTSAMKEEDAKISLEGIVLSQAERFAASFELSAEERDLLRPANVVEFLLTDYAYRMMKAGQAGKLFREQPFVFSLPASRLDPSFPEEERVLIQGVIDVYFEEDGELVLLDYKTDHASPEELMQKYHVQLDYYTEALEKLEGKHVKEAVLYSVWGATIINI